ncbi:MAG TPA: aspartate/glutamate racemase family protein [Microvirga sp.]|jgi:hypothetical protein|nr:aspartate/glutamate racemase family protein [Microvirga sp.]
MSTTPDRPRVALIHAVTVAIDPITAAFASLWPEAERLNLLDDSLSVDRTKAQDLSSGLHDRIGALADYAMAAGAHGILYTCSAFGPGIESVARRLPVPVLKPNEAMFVEALDRGTRIGMLATFGPSVTTMEEEFADAARERRPDATIRTILVPGAMDALKGGDADTHNRLIAERAPELADCDAVMLAHFSTSRAKAAVERALGREVLTSPTAAVTALKRAIGA